MNKGGVNLQIVYLKLNGKLTEMELSDTIYKTHRIVLSFPKPQKFKLYMILEVRYDVEPIKSDESVER